MATKDRILDAATELFNQATVAEVSTNHIAEAAGISPGNLYYHYKNKEMIIRAILERMFATFGELWVLPEGRQLTLEDLHDLLTRLFTLLWRFRFFDREQLSLLRRDPLLAARYQEIQVQRLGEQARYFQKYIDDGVLVFDNPDHFRSIITACWILSNNWLSFVETGGETVQPDHIQQGIDMIFVVIRPYLAELYQHALAHVSPAHADLDKDVFYD
ncbi:MAG: TetR/AcrR family transcriptional regulator [Deinococcota bacterium]